jgi:hypothetical protein
VSDQSNLGHQLPGVLGEVADVLIDAEQWHHEQGWDNTPPTLYGVCRSPEGKYEVVAARLGRFTDLGPADELALIATIAENLRLGDVLTTAYPHPPVAHMVTAEGWARGQWVGTNDDELDDRPLADIPGSVEMRFGVAVVGVRCVLLERTRGVEPRMITDEGAYEAQGALVDALSRVQAALARTPRREAQ